MKFYSLGGCGTTIGLRTKIFMVKHFHLITLEVVLKE